MRTRSRITKNKANITPPKQLIVQKQQDDNMQVIPINRSLSQAGVNGVANFRKKSVIIIDSDGKPSCMPISDIKYVNPTPSNFMKLVFNDNSFCDNEISEPDCIKKQSNGTMEWGNIRVGMSAPINSTTSRFHRNIFIFKCIKPTGSSVSKNSNIMFGFAKRELSSINAQDIINTSEKGEHFLVSQISDGRITFRINGKMYINKEEDNPDTLYDGEFMGVGVDFHTRKLHYFKWNSSGSCVCESIFDMPVNKIVYKTVGENKSNLVKESTEISATIDGCNLYPCVTLSETCDSLYLKVVGESLTKNFEKINGDMAWMNVYA